MVKLDLSKIPKYSQLPIKPGAPAAHSNWGVFGDDDEVGCFNFLTPEGIIEAAKLIRDGKPFGSTIASDMPSRRSAAALPLSIL